ncbi:MAG: hypothetical protein ABIM40_09840 [Pseudomonadota bacterium]
MEHIPPPRGENFTVLGVRLEPREIAWVEKNGGLVWFADEMERTMASLPDQDTVAEWRNLVLRRQEIETEARMKVYTALKKVLPPGQWDEIIEDHHEPGDTFLTLFRSYVRYFFRLVPDLALLVEDYEAVLTRLETVEAKVLAMFHETQDSVGRALVFLTMTRLQGK